MSLDQQALEYHSRGKPGKVEVVSSKPCFTERDLSLAYSPGVAAPCKAIAKDPLLAYEYTTRGNLVAVITNGTAVLGLGNIGPLAAKPVMEGKGVLFKQFAGINVFDIELNTASPDEFINTVKALEPTFGGINLEDIRAPECFYIEKALKEQLRIPVFHDDQHGTAIISSAGLLNALELTEKKIGEIKLVVNGAGAAAISCAKLVLKLGVRRENLLMCDSRGVLYKGRKEGINEFKSEFVVDTDRRSLADALKGADVFFGLSVAGVMTAEMLASMAPHPIVFAMANPDPEIDPHTALQVRDDVIMATGRSDYPNQVNNVLGYPFIFRGALDVRATTINEEMMLAAVHAIANLAREDVPDSVSAAYGGKMFRFGAQYILPKPFDPRVLKCVSSAVARAAIETGVAQKPITDFQAYADQLEGIQSIGRGFVRNVIQRVKSQAKRQQKSVPTVVFPEGNSTKILRALQIVSEDQVIRPILIGYENRIRAKIRELDLYHLKDIPIIQPSQHEYYPEYVREFYKMRHRKGVMVSESERLMADPNFFAPMMVHVGHADGLVTGATQNYADAVRPIFQIIGTGFKKTASGLSVVLIKDRVLFFCDTTVNIDPSAEQIATIAIHISRVCRYFGFEPRIAMLSYSNFSARPGSPEKMKRAVELVQRKQPDLIVDGEMQADTAVNSEIVQRIFPFCRIKRGANVLVFPNLDAGNIAYKLVQQLGGGEVLGPFLIGINKPANVLQRTCVVDDIVNTVALTALQIQATSEQFHATKEQILDR